MKTNNIINLQVASEWNVEAANVLICLLTCRQETDSLAKTQLVISAAEVPKISTVLLLTLLTAYFLFGGWRYTLFILTNQNHCYMLKLNDKEISLNSKVILFNSKVI